MRFQAICYTFRPFAARTPRGMALIQFLKERLVTFTGHGAAASFSERKQDANPARFNARRRIRTAVCCAAAPRLPPSSIPPHRTDRAAARRETELGETARQVGQNTGEGASRSRPGAAATVSQTRKAFPAAKGRMFPKRRTRRRFLRPASPRSCRPYRRGGKAAPAAAGGKAGANSRAAADTRGQVGTAHYTGTLSKPLRTVIPACTRAAFRQPALAEPVS